MSKSLQKSLGKISYSSYNQISTLLGLSSMGFLGANFLFPELSGLNIVFSFICTYLFTTSQVFEYGQYTKDIVSIKKLYEQFIDNYKDLNNAFNLKSPYEIYLLFCNLLYDGYLSLEKNFHYSKDNPYDIIGLTGADIITGNGVCRHASCMLSDILNSNDISSSVINGIQRDYICCFNLIDEKKFSKEELIDKYASYISDDPLVKECFGEVIDIMEARGKGIDVSFKLERIKNLTVLLGGNHAITYAYKDDKYYFLDPINNQILRVNDKKNKCLNSYEGEFKIKGVLFGKKNDFKYNNIDTISLEEEKSISLDMEKIYKENMDVFDKFYFNNLELYEDICSEMKRVRGIKC